MRVKVGDTLVEVSACGLAAFPAEPDILPAAAIVAKTLSIA